MKIFIGIITGLINGLFGAGGGTVLVPCLEKFLKTQPQKAHATAIAVILPLSVISALLYARSLPELKIVLITCGGGILGGLVGAKLLSKISGYMLHIVFGIFMLFGAVRMIWQG